MNERVERRNILVLNGFDTGNIGTVEVDENDGMLLGTRLVYMKDRELNQRQNSCRKREEDIPQYGLCKSALSDSKNRHGQKQF